VPPLEAFWLGRVAYRDASALMGAVAAARAAAEIADTLLLLEHDHVYTLGRRGQRADILIEPAMLERRGIDVVDTDRGGLVTYHGPGQLVAYPVLDLGPTASATTYVAALERALIEVLAGFGITASTIEGLRGVWVDDAKIAAIGVHLSNGITTHGFALNVDPELELFGGIVPCGITDKRVTSTREVTGARIPISLIAKRAARALAAALDRDLHWPHPDRLRALEVHDG
jgi:lipoyl(octanoyl) transferase